MNVPPCENPPTAAELIRIVEKAGGRLTVKEVEGKEWLVIKPWAAGAP